GPQLRVAGDVTYTGTAGPVALAHGQINYKDSVSNKYQEITYSGQTTVAVVGCGTCHDNSAQHDPHVSGGDYGRGSFPLRVPTGEHDYAVVERSAVGTSTGTSAGEFKAGNACIWCHKSRKDVNNYVLPGTNAITSTTWGPHEGPDADVYSGKGGYEYPAPLKYSTSTHSLSLANGCVDCHMPPVAENGGIGNHSFYPQQSACKQCHATATTFDVNGGQTKVKQELQALRVKLDSLKLLTRDGINTLGTALTDQSFSLDESLPASAVGAAGRLPVDGPTAGALYNYFVMARGSGFGVHNPTYTGQILYDSISAIGGDLTGITRPPAQ
ncbi:MAG TPA: hypothetical protein VGC79_20840, partial [Polyangiaceae bacterium]